MLNIRVLRTAGKEDKRCVNDKKKNILSVQEVFGPVYTEDKIIGGQDYAKVVGQCDFL